MTTDLCACGRPLDGSMAVCACCETALICSYCAAHSGWCETCIDGLDQIDPDIDTDDDGGFDE